MTEASRRYSVDEVNDALPAVAARFEAVMQLRTQLKTIYAALEEAGHPPGQDAAADATAKVVRDRAVFDGMAEALREQVAAINETGCVIRDVEIGLCDWRGDHEGREVWLCWRYGEATLGWFHEVDTGFAGRRPVAELRPRGALVTALAGKVAVITGASRGIGRAIALRFAGAGARVGLIARDRVALDGVAAEVRAAGGEAAIAVADVVDPAAITRAAAALTAALGPCDILVNNAGAVARGSLLTMSDLDWRRVQAVNLDGTFHAIRAFGPALVARTGRIINIASRAGREGTPLLAAYCAAKHGVVGLTRALAEELRGAKVSVNAICPGSVDTEMLRAGLPGAEPDMTPDDIARTALFLAADAPAALTGACIDVFA